MMKYQNLFDDICYWLEEDDSPSHFRFEFLQYLVSGHYSAKLDAVKSKPIKSVSLDSQSSELRMIYLDGFYLSQKALQFCIDSCLFVIDAPTLHYFLCSLGCFAVRQFGSRPIELVVSHIDVSSLDFRCRRKYFRNFSKSSPSNRSKLYSAIDSFLKHSDFKDYFLKFLDWDSSLVIDYD